MYINKEQIEIFAKQSYGAQQIALWVYPHFKRHPNEVAQELREVVPQSLLADVVGNLLLNCLTDAMRNPPKFLDDHLKQTELQKKTMEGLFKEELKQFAEKELKQTALPTKTDQPPTQKDAGAS
jgi:hypothetical protein